MKKLDNDIGYVRKRKTLQQLLSDIQGLHWKLQEKSTFTVLCNRFCHTEMTPCKTIYCQKVLCTTFLNLCTPRSKLLSKQFLELYGS